MQLITITKITNEQELSEAQAIRTKLKQELKVIEDKKEKVSRPLLDAIAARRAEFAPTLKRYVEAIANVDKLLKEYQKAVLAIQEAKQKKILEDGRLKTETVINRLATIDEIPTKGFRKQEVVKVLNMALIPPEYFDLNLARVKADLKAGKEVNGAILTTEMIPTE